MRTLVMTDTHQVQPISSPPDQGGRGQVEELGGRGTFMSSGNELSQSSSSYSIPASSIHDLEWDDEM